MPGAPAVDNPCILVGDGNRGPVEVTSLVKLVNPFIERIGFSGRRAHDRASAVNQEASKMLTDKARLIDELALVGSVETKAGIAAANALSYRIDRTLLIELDMTISLPAGAAGLQPVPGIGSAD